MTNETLEAASADESATFVRGGPACAFCATVLSEDDAPALITVQSHTYGQRYFGAHARCLQSAMPAEIARFLDVADVPAGALRELLPRSAQQR